VTNKNKLIIPQLAGIYDALAPASYSFMRFATGAVLVPHGVQKIIVNAAPSLSASIAKAGLPFPELLAYLAIGAESVGAICLAIGLLTRIAALTIFIEMIVIVFFFQWRFGYFWTARGYEFALLWALLCLAIIFRGGGRYSVDRLIGKEI
jgi:putative oxidoreductase